VKLHSSLGEELFCRIVFLRKVLFMLCRIVCLL